MSRIEKISYRFLPGYEGTAFTMKGDNGDTLFTGVVPASRQGTAEVSLADDFYGGVALVDHNGIERDIKIVDFRPANTQADILDAIEDIPNHPSQGAYRLTFATGVARATVTIIKDGIPHDDVTDNAGDVTFPVNAGTWQWTVAKDGCDGAMGSVNVTANVTVDVTLTAIVQPPASAPPGMAELTVSARDFPGAVEGAQFRIEFVAAGPVAIGDAIFTNHFVTVTTDEDGEGSVMLFTKATLEAAGISPTTYKVLSTDCKDVYDNTLGKTFEITSAGGELQALIEAYEAL